MLKNQNFDERMRKYKKIYIYPRNNNFKNKDDISAINIKKQFRIKNNLNTLIIDNNDIVQKSKSFLNYFSSKTSSNHYLKSKNKINFDYNNAESFQRNLTCKKHHNIFYKNMSKNNILDKYEEILEELKYMKQNNKSININININNDFKIHNKKKSKSLSKCSTVSSQKNSYENNNNNNNNNDINKNILNDQEKTKTNDRKDIFINDCVKDKSYSNDKHTNKNIKLFLRKNNSNGNIRITNMNHENRKLNILKKIFINNKKTIKKENNKKPQKLKIKINKISNKYTINEKRNKSIPIIYHISSSTNKNNNKAKFKSNSEIKNHKNYYLDNIKEDILKNNKLNYNKINNTINTISNADYSKNEFRSLNESNNISNNSNNYIIKERYLNKENKNNNNINLDISLLNEETDNQIKNWINKEKKSKELPKMKSNKNIFIFESINRQFHNYQISNKYFNNNEFMMINNKINNKPIKSINLGDYFDLELSRFNNRLNNYYYNNKNIQNTNTINSKHIFKPIY